ncbi:hypothetical protein K402DRAFT_414401 [Aulographum hederae CBS 113979]|uniref:Ornithine decarboxylase antizyme n=1 Tax=Aulographum hederae CBS 113979 TaxID=1176131 RepID=A0A6G1GS72_9PEZI|nr:hypothetical protein K402DRAFT_414401 [Aulographum hederae CBS 113979]
MSNNEYSMRTSSPTVSASCYSVDVSTASLTGFHYSTTGAGGGGDGKLTTIIQGIPSPPQSPPLAAYNNQHDSRTSSIISTKSALRSSLASRGGAAYTIAEECERLFCGTLRSVFLEVSPLAMGALSYTGHNNYLSSSYHQQFDNHNTIFTQYGHTTEGLPTPMGSPEGLEGVNPGTAKLGLVQQWVEIFDYKGDTHFRGFLAPLDPSSPFSEKALFVFFDPHAVVGKDLKPGLMALLELCEHPSFDCTRVIACLDRTSRPSGLVRDLGWVGFEPATLVDWTRSDDILSERWLFLGMDV